MRVLAKALPLLVGLSEESQTITVPLIEGFMENKVECIQGYEAMDIWQLL